MDVIRENLGPVKVVFPYKYSCHEIEYPGIEVPKIWLVKDLSQDDY